MLELEENSRKLEMLKEKIKSLGESLWHNFARKPIKKIGRSNS